MKRCLACEQRFNAADWRCPRCGHTPQQIDSYPAFAPELAAENTDYRAEAFDKLFQLEAGSFWFRSRNRLLAWALRRYFPAARSLLEIGCGTGYVLRALSRRLPRLQLAGSDVLSAALTYAARRSPAATLVQMDARRIPFDNHFDIIGAFDVIEHITEHDVVLGEMFRAVRPGGGVLLTVPQHPFLWSAYDEYGHHKRRYTRTDLVAVVQHAGFEVVHVTSFVSLLLPLMLASRWRQRRQQRSVYSPHQEFHIPRLLNKALENTQTVERWLLRTGISLPAGGSLLLVARRPEANAAGAGAPRVMAGQTGP